MLGFFKSISTLGVLLAIIWFAMSHEFAAVLLGIGCVSAFMMTFLPVQAGDEHS
ncbi:hypothetical protein [uncultured Oxalicibacterium sp.]|uniref:hypothetical protein n=1 Tax=uncultured Oxalicibacterium sp. TaxID=1168540 RepID=UPI0025FFB890|nr:hypothetical protein [uncultured Oxalicibacterium sp.]